MATEQTQTIETLIAVEARDLLPETWEALAQAETFGPAALERRHNRVVKNLFGLVLGDEEQADLEELDGRVIEYAGKMLAYALLDPGIEYWSRQAQSYSISERESKSYGNRADDLRKLKDAWLKDLAALKIEIGPLLVVRGPEHDRPRVANVGDDFLHLTPDPFALPPAWIAPEDLV